MGSTEASAYQRLRVYGRLINRGYLHVGDGEATPFAERRCSRPQEAEGEFDTLCVDGDGRPYLPGASLRGFLRAAGERCGDPARQRKLFGHVDGAAGRAGAVRIFDAPLTAPPDSRPEQGFWDPRRSTTVRAHVSLDPVTGTAKDNLLFRREVVPPGGMFRVELEAENLDEEDLATLLGLLAAWDGGPASVLGKGAGHGQGRVAFELDRVEVLDRASFETWLSGDEPLERGFRTLESPPPLRETVSAGVGVLDFRLHTETPFLVNDPDYVSGIGEEPKLEFSRGPDGLPLVPGSTLRGLLRGRARRIMATLLVARSVPLGQAGSRAEESIQWLFGDTGRRGPLWLTDARADSAAERRQFFNGIDRFTGGVADGKLYQVRAADCRSLHGQIAWEIRKLPAGQWWKGLLLLVVRDALEGELAFGWGKGRGYGAFRLRFDWEGRSLGDWPALVEALRETGLYSEAGNWLAELHRHMDELAARPSRRISS